MTDDWNKLEEWVNGPCISCEEASSLSGSEHVAMPVTRPQYVDSYLEGLAGPEESHGLGGHCVNPKCDATFDESMVAPDGSVTCPNCGAQQNVNQTKDTPGGMTRAGLTLEQMGQIGEQVVLRMGELPGVGAIKPASNSYTYPIDAIVIGQKGKFGCEIKTNHSQAQERFKLGGKQERLEKIKYCLENGLKPALIGVRLNFFTDKAYIFFREGLTDTWVGNQRMMHVATIDFSALNPFKSPDPQAQALAVENAHLPDQSTDEDEFAGAFGDPVMAKVADFNEEHPRDDEGKFVAKKDYHHVKVVDKKGKHTHNVIRCKHCGKTLWVPADHTGRIKCDNCDKDAERDLKLAKVVLSDPRYADQVAREAGWGFKGRNASGERVYDYNGEDGRYHIKTCGSGSHGKHAGEIDAQRLRQRIARCMSGKCMCGPADTPLAAIAEPTAPVIHIGQVINGGVVYGLDGDIALIQNLDTGQNERVPVAELQSAHN